MNGLDNCSFSAFVSDGTDVEIDPPRGYISTSGHPAVTGWILNVGRGANHLSLHFRSREALLAMGEAIMVAAQADAGDPS